MPTIFTKLNFKSQAEILVVNAPPSFEPEMAALHGVEILREAKAARQITFALAFGTTLSEVNAFAKTISKKAEGDAVIWFAYPKGSSKKYTCEFNRDTGWTALGEAGFEPVRQIGIDEDWSALRFRRVEHIKTMTRGFAMTKVGKAKAAKNK
jgi:hypothetical protein